MDLPETKRRSRNVLENVFCPRRSPDSRMRSDDRDAGKRTSTNVSFICKMVKPKGREMH